MSMTKSIQFYAGQKSVKTKSFFGGTFITQKQKYDY